MSKERKRICAACAVIRRGDKLLVGKRAFGSMSGKWELIGGKIEGSETPAEAVVRELREELSVTASVVAELDAYEHRYDEFDLVLFPIICKLSDANTNLSSKDHSEVRWVSLKKVLRLKFVEADYRALNEYMARFPD